jgi:hypothetical protein
MSCNVSLEAEQGGKEDNISLGGKDEIEENNLLLHIFPAFLPIKPRVSESHCFLSQIKYLDWICAPAYRRVVTTALAVNVHVLYSTLALNSRKAAHFRIQRRSADTSQ